MVHSYDGKILSNKKEQTLYIYNSLDLTGLMLSKNKIISMGHIFYDSIYVTFFK